MKHGRWALILGVLLSPAGPQDAAAQENQALLKEMMEENRGAVDALVLYPDSVLHRILEASAHPQLLVRLGVIQEKSSSGFAALAADLPREEQEKLWELSRFPSLVDEIVRGGPKETSELATIAEGYPEEVRPVAIELGSGRYGVVAGLHELRETADAALEALVEPYSFRVREAVRGLLRYPEILSILTDNLEMTVLVGDAYARNPEAVLARAGELRVEAARRNSEAIDDWARELEENPDALEELEESAAEFAREEGHDPSSAPTVSSTTRVTVTVDPYPYWFGYPYWYATPYWYPYPYWYHWGFYYGTGGTVIVFGMPTYHYTYWHFHGHHHHYRYPHLSDHWLRHHDRHRSVESGFGEAIEDWRDANEGKFDGDWLRDDGNRAERLAEFGRFEEEFAARNRIDPANPISREEFLRENESRFRNLESSRVREVRADRRPGDRAAEGNARSVIRGESGGDAERLRGARDRHEAVWSRAAGGRRGSGGIRRPRGRR
ncbi:MAG TPA: DUF3300 domain-containing protein [Longimicrobiales bacterium]|nr:DUF3300 domain-containing protein [Longimicrobiales bacterium]